MDLLGIPVAPLRDALRVLETEGVLKIHPRSGIEFVKPGLEPTKSTYQFRVILERAAVRVFAEMGDDTLVDAIIQEHRDLMTRIERDGLDPTALAEIEHMEARLHDTIIGMLANPLIENSYKRMHNYLRLVRVERRLTPPIALRSLREHMVILQACKARDPDAAEAALQAHFNAALQRHMGIY